MAHLVPVLYQTPRSASSWLYERGRRIRTGPQTNTRNAAYAAKTYHAATSPSSRFLASVFARSCTNPAPLNRFARSLFGRRPSTDACLVGRFRGLSACRLRGRFSTSYNARQHQLTPIAGECRSRPALAGTFRRSGAGWAS